MKRTLFSLTIGLAFLCMLQPATIIAPASAQSGESSGASWERLVGDEAETFADVGSAVEAFKSRLAAGDKQGVAKLLGLDPVELMKQADFDDNFAEIAEAAAAGVETRGGCPRPANPRVGREELGVPVSVGACGRDMGLRHL